MLGVRNAGDDQRSGLDDGAEKTPALESVSNVVWRKPLNKKSSLWAFFHQGTERGRKKAKCTVEGCTKPVVVAQATSNLAQHTVAHHKSFPAYVEHMKEALKTVANTQPRDEGIMGFMKREAPAKRTCRRHLPVSPRVVIMNEWEAYKGAEVLEETVHRVGGPLGWWRQNEMLYPHIARLARKYLAGQASSAASERLFSQAGLVVTAKRNRMTGDTAADIIFH